MIVAVDFDNTLVEDSDFPTFEYKLKPYAKETINTLTNYGIKFVLNTARYGWYRLPAIWFIKKQKLPIQTPLLNKKIAADVYIDDRDIFSNSIDWHKIKHELLKKIGKEEKMYYVKKTFEISASHKLNLGYESKCKNLHGHNWEITVYCKAEELNENGMLVDFTEIKKNIKDKLDHKNLNEMLNFNPTAENIAKWIQEQVKYCYKVDVQESEGNIASYEVQN